LKDVNIGVTAESVIRKEHRTKRQWKNTGKETRDNLKDINISVQKEIRKEQNGSRKAVEEHWKGDSRQLEGR
jgi:hypothetical protein